MAKKKKYYVVWQGVNPGIYETWAACQENIKNYPNAKYKSFSSLEEATLAYRGGWQPGQKKSSKPVPVNKNDIPHYSKSISVDAASSGNPGKMEYRGVWTHNAEILFHQGPFEQGTNNIGEFLALVHALALLDKKGNYDIPVYTDSRTALAWVRKKKAKTTLQQNQRNKILFELIRRAEQWLATHEIKTEIIKWETENWGEIPADFGRK